MNKTAFAIRTHQFTEREIELYDYAKKYFGESNTFIACNNNIMDIKIPKEYNNIFFNKQLVLNDSELFWPHNWSWLCGDYWYYAIINFLKEYDYIWLCEPDIYFSNENSSDFFKSFETLDFDFIGKGYGTLHENASFFKTSKVLEGKPMTCLFGMTRLKTKLIDILYKERIRLSRSFMDKKFPSYLYPNDEIFVCTTLNRMNCSIRGLENFSQFDFRLFTTDENEAMLIEDARKIKGNFVIHPVLDEDTFIEKKLNSFDKKLKENQNISLFIRNILFKTKNEKLKKILISKVKEKFNNFINNL